MWRLDRRTQLQSVYFLSACLLRNALSPIDGGISASTDLSFNNYSDFIIIELLKSNDADSTYS